ncbi:MAG: DUF2851 family protein, partial [Candidatus Cloacimonetes bacterium]|nr:DUF2851 family protein [Candidatus Cloacimonadota bacterium]
MFQEKFIYHIWDAQHLQRNLKTVSGNSVEIIYQGRWNTDFGPDFRDAVIKINSLVMHGDVEIHLNSRDWVNHHHDEDPAYNNTILHVVYNHDDQLNMTISEQGGKIEILEICNFLDQEIEKLLSSYKDLPFIPKPEFCSFFAGLSGDILIPLLSRLGQKRLENKIKRFKAELYFTDYDQILYQGIMEALGYSKNKFQMLLFSNQITYRKLQCALENDFREKKIIFLLLNYSNLKEKLPENLKSLCSPASEPETDKFLAAVTPPLKWELFRIRPGNHPAVRMIQASIL